MSDEQQIHDENLRLVLSTDQEQWLQGKIKESRGMVRAMLVLLAGGCLYGHSSPEQ